MKKFAVLSAFVSLFLSLFAVLGVAAPAQAAPAPSAAVTSSSGILQGWLNQNLWNPPTVSTSGFPGTTPAITIAPALPAGLNFVDNGNGTASFTGKPTVAYAPTTHTITASDGGTTVTTNIDVSVASQITVTSNTSQLPINTLLASAVTASFSNDSFVNNATGNINFFLTGFIPANTADCSDITLNIAASGGCSAYANENGTAYNWVGVDFTSSRNIVLTLAANKFTTGNGSGQGSWGGLNVNLANGDGIPPMNFGYAGVQFTNTPAPPPAPPAATVTVDLSASVGQSVFGAATPFSASGLLAGSSYDITVRSTPQVIAQGSVPAGGSISGSATIPSNLEPGWHTITFTTTAADGTETKDVVWFKISANGTLLSKSDTVPAELAFTPAPPVQYWFWALLVLALGLGAYVYGREFNPEFMRVMSLVRNESGELVFVKRRIRSDDL